MRHGLASGWLQRAPDAQPFPIGAEVVPMADLLASIFLEDAVCPILTVGDYLPDGDIVCLSADRQVYAVMPPEWLSRVQ